MTYKVLIADDEPMIRRGIASCIDWADEGFELAGEASNGEAALLAVGRQPIDILITDIKMPLMDGLELTRRASGLFPDIQVILISSYSDFEYAREAVKLGVVVDYLLKPTMEPEQLLRLLRQCRERLEAADRERQANLAARDRSATKRIELEERLKNLLRGEGTQPADGEPLWLKEPLVAAVWKLDSRPGDERDYGIGEVLRLDSAREKLGLWQSDAVAFKTYEDELVLVLADRSGGGFAAVERLQRKLSMEAQLLFTVGVSPVFHRIEALPDAYGWARKALERMFREGKNRCYPGKIPASAAAAKEASAAENEDGAWAGLRDRFSSMLASSNEEESGKALRQLFTLWSQRALPRRTVTQQAESLLTLMWIWHFRRNAEETVGRIVDKLLEVRRFDTLPELTAFVEREFRTIREAGKLPVVAADSGGAHAVQLAITYVQQHYRRELSLQEVADHVHMSRNYFSEQFKRLTGLNFIDFVIQLRIHHAKRLLQTTSRRVYEIGALSGFNSPKHFLKLFKREVRCTPVEYRQSAALSQHPGD